MWPTFEIYLSILNGSWLPWTEGHTHTARLHRLLNVVHPVAGCQTDAFFRELLPLLDIACRPAMASLRCEVMNLALHSSNAGNCCDGAFLQLPAAGYRQQFCHLLTGFTLGGYTRWMKSIESSAQGEQCRLYFRRRMMEKLESFIDIKIWHGESPHCEPQMVYLVKTSLCILYSRLTGDGNQVAPGFCARERLQQQLSNSGLEEVFCSRLMSLFDRLTAQPETVPAPANIAAPANAANPATTADSAPRQLTSITEAELANLLTDLKSNFEEMKQGLETTLKGANPSNGKAGKESTQLLEPHKVQEMLGISKATLGRYRKKGLLPYTQVCGKYWYAEEDVKRLIRITRI